MKVVVTCRLDIDVVFTTFMYVLARGAKMHQWTSSNPQSPVLPGRHTTIFVNAANMPSGRKASEVEKQGVRLFVKHTSIPPLSLSLHLDRSNL